MKFHWGSGFQVSRLADRPLNASVPFPPTTHAINKALSKQKQIRHAQVTSWQGIEWLVRTSFGKKKEKRKKKKERRKEKREKRKKNSEKRKEKEKREKRKERGERREERREKRERRESGLYEPALVKKSERTKKENKEKRKRKTKESVPWL